MRVHVVRVVIHVYFTCNSRGNARLRSVRKQNLLWVVRVAKVNRFHFRCLRQQITQTVTASASHEGKQIILIQQQQECVWKQQAFEPGSYASQIQPF